MLFLRTHGGFVVSVPLPCAPMTFIWISSELDPNTAQIPHRESRLRMLVSSHPLPGLVCHNTTCSSQRPEADSFPGKLSVRDCGDASVQARRLL